jgi:hypothetical protein
MDTACLTKVSKFLTIILVLFQGCSPSLYYRRSELLTTYDLPLGAVVPFYQSSCPTGWEEFTDLKGRIPLGEGSGNLDSRGDALTSRSLSSSGGREYTTGLPAYSGLGDQNTPGPDRVLSAIGSGGYGNALVDPVVMGGASETESNLPPYIVMTYCKKTSLTSGVAMDALVYSSQSTCSSGWNADGVFSDRFILGKGVGNLDTDGLALTSRSLASTGGYENTPGGCYAASDGIVTASPSSAAFLGPDILYKNATDTTLGGVAAESNLPPYIVLQTCRSQSDGSTIRKNTVVGFDLSSCPSGWAPYSPAQGRMVVGASVTRAVGVTGGLEYTTGLPASTSSVATTTDPTLRYLASYLADFHYSTQSPDTTVNGVKADSNLPPFYVLKYCMKE